jgi:hypothetical protein
MFHSAVSELGSFQRPSIPPFRVRGASLLVQRKSGWFPSIYFIFHEA